MSGADICLWVARIFVYEWRGYLLMSGADICLWVARIFVNEWGGYLFEWRGYFGVYRELVWNCFLVYGVNKYTPTFKTICFFFVLFSFKVSLMLHHKVVLCIQVIAFIQQVMKVTNTWAYELIKCFLFSNILIKPSFTIIVATTLFHLRCVVYRLSPCVTICVGNVHDRVVLCTCHVRACIFI